MKSKKLSIGERGTLDQLRKGQRSKVIAIHGENKRIKQRLLDMGIVAGVEILMKKIAPLGDPLDIELRGYELCMRKEDTRKIEVEVIS